MKKIFKLFSFVAIVSFFSFLEIEKSEAQLVVECRGAAGHCMEYENVTYYGKAYVSKPQSID